MTTKKHNYAIDICKAFATLMVINSHMQVCYPEKYQMFASGGAIGNALFFFCSGFTLFLGNSRLNFFDWYKKRVSRIIPSVLAMAIVVSIVWGNDISMPKILIGGGTGLLVVF